MGKRQVKQGFSSFLAIFYFDFLIDFRTFQNVQLPNPSIHYNSAYCIFHVKIYHFFAHVSKSQNQFYDFDVRTFI